MKLVERLNKLTENNSNLYIEYCKELDSMVTNFLLENPEVFDMAPIDAKTLLAKMGIKGCYEMIDFIDDKVAKYPNGWDGWVVDAIGTWEFDELQPDLLEMFAVPHDMEFASSVLHCNTALVLYRHLIDSSMTIFDKMKAEFEKLDGEDTWN